MIAVFFKKDLQKVGKIGFVNRYERHDSVWRPNEEECQYHQQIQLLIANKTSCSLFVDFKWAVDLLYNARYLEYLDFYFICLVSVGAS